MGKPGASIPPSFYLPSFSYFIYPDQQALTLISLVYCRLWSQTHYDPLLFPSLHLIDIINFLYHYFCPVLQSVFYIIVACCVGWCWYLKAYESTNHSPQPASPVSALQKLEYTHIKTQCHRYTNVQTRRHTHTRTSAPGWPETKLHQQASCVSRTRFRDRQWFEENRPKARASCCLSCFCNWLPLLQ